MTLSKVAGKRGITWRLDTYENGRRVRRMFKSLVEAESYIQNGRQGITIASSTNAAQAQSSARGGLSVAECIAQWQAHCKSLQKHSANYRERVMFAERALVKHFGTRPADSIDKAAFDAYLAHRTAAGVSASTVKKEYCILVAALRWCASRGIVSACSLGGYWRGVRIVEKTISVPSPEELQRVHDALPHEDARRLFWFLCATGCRITEAIELMAEDIHSDCIHFHRGVKGGYERHAPRPEFPFALPSSGHVFKYEDHKWRRDVFMHMVWRACQRAGVPRFSPHTLRHAYATYLLASGEPLYNLMASCGWRSISMVQRYVSVARRYQNVGQFIPRFSVVLVIVLGIKSRRKPARYCRKRGCAALSRQRLRVQVSSLAPAITPPDVRCSVDIRRVFSADRLAPFPSSPIPLTMPGWPLSWAVLFAALCVLRRAYASLSSWRKRRAFVTARPM